MRKEYISTLASAGISKKLFTKYGILLKTDRHNKVRSYHINIFV